MLIVEFVLDMLTYVSAFILTYFSVFIILTYLNNPKYIENFCGTRKWTPFVSVVVPAYNEQFAIHQCIESIMNLNYPKNKLEIIVVDDCSTDDTYKFIKSYEKYGVKVVQTPENSGCAAKAKNYGVQFAKGEILAFLDSDSFVEKNALRKMLPYFDENVGSVTAAVRIRDPKNILEKVQYIEYEVILFLRRILMTLEAVYVTPGPFSIFTREAFESVSGFDNDSLTEDHEIALHLQAKGYLIRSTCDATVTTEAMPNISMWIKQRTRWLRGGIYNRIKHIYLLDFRKYGDFGVLAILLDMAMLLPVTVMILGPVLRVLFYDHWMERIGFLNVLYSVNALWFIGLISILICILWLIHISELK